MEDDREKIFASIRRGLRGCDKASAERSSKSPLVSKIESDFKSRFARFKSELSALGGEALVAETEADANELILARLQPTTSVFIYDVVRIDYAVLTASMTESREARFGIEFGPGYDKRDAASFDCAIAGCVACVAETGSIVLKTDMRLPAALATRLFVIARSEQLIPTLDELFTDRFSNFDGSNLLIATGPSRTADIEKELVTGVHGPKEVSVVFIQR